MTCDTTADKILLKLVTQIPDRIGTYMTSASTSDLIIATIDATLTKYDWSLKSIQDISDPTKAVNFDFSTEFLVKSRFM